MCNIQKRSQKADFLDMINNHCHRIAINKFRRGSLLNLRIETIDTRSCEAPVNLRLWVTLFISCSHASYTIEYALNSLMKQLGNTSVTTLIQLYVDELSYLTCQANA